MKITDGVEVQAEMIEIDNDIRYLRLATPGCYLPILLWFIPSVDGKPFDFDADESKGVTFAPLSEALANELEDAYKARLKARLQ